MAQPATVVLTVTVVHRTVPSTALTAVRKVVALSRVVISRHVAHRPSVLASKHHVAAHLHAENSALLELTGPFGALFFALWAAVVSAPVGAGFLLGQRLGRSGVGLHIGRGAQRQATRAAPVGAQRWWRT